MRNNALWIILQKLRTPLLAIIVTYSIAILGMVLIPTLKENGEIYHLSFFDAFYFVSYMASTIGFGESPFDFTYAQKLWVTFSIYLTVIGWFYGIGALVTSITDKTLRFEMMRSRFKKEVNRIPTDFVIILGYTYVNSEIIKKFHSANLEAVLIDKNEEKINFFLLEENSQDIPVLVGDALLSETLKDAGIQNPNCKAIVSLFTDEVKNLRISILTKFLNSKVQVVAKSTVKDITNSILDTDIAKPIDPFSIFAKRLDVAMHAPHALILENWIYDNSDLMDEAQFLPIGRYIVCGYGRFGVALQESFDKHGVDYVFIDKNRLAPQKMIETGRFIRANPDDKEVLIEAGIKEASVLVVGTKDDIDNLSVLITAKKLNPDIYIIVRENTMQEISIFQEAHIDWVFMKERILINKTSLALTKPLQNCFLKKVIQENEIWAKSLVKWLRTSIGANPNLMDLLIDKENSYAIYHELKRGTEIPIETLLHRLSDRKQTNHAIPLMIKRGDKEILLPQRGTKLKIGDQLLIACNEDSKEEIELIASNIYELHYALSGEEKQTWFFGNMVGMGN